jgi:hypothetical protein
MTAVMMTGEDATSFMSDCGKKLRTGPTGSVRRNASWNLQADRPLPAGEKAAGPGERYSI